jgi:hypothetical protein
MPDRPRSERAPLRLQTPIVDEAVDSNQTTPAPNATNAPADTASFLEATEDVIKYAAQEAKVDPDLLMAVESYHDELEMLRQRTQMRRKQIEEQYTDELTTCRQQAELSQRQGMKRARDVLNASEEKLNQEYKKDRAELDTELKRKYARSRTARQHPLAYLAHQALKRPSFNAEPRANSQADSSHPPLPPSPTHMSQYGGITPGAEPTMAAGGLTSNSSYIRSAFPSDSRQSPRTPGDDPPIDPQIRGASPTNIFIDCLSPNPDPEIQTGCSPSSPKMLSSERCMEANCFALAILGRNYCHQHVGREQSGAAF